MDPLLMAAILAFVVLIHFLGLVLVIKVCLRIVPPKTALVFTGRRRPDGRGYRVVTAGRALKMPFLEQVTELTLAPLPLELNLRLHSKDGQQVSVGARGRVRISKQPAQIHHAIERFLGSDTDQIVRVAGEVLEGHLRQVVVTREASAVRSDLAGTLQQLRAAAEEDLAKLGLELDSLTAA